MSTPSSGLFHSSGGGGSAGGVDGPETSTDNAAARYDGTDGNTLQDSAVVIADRAGAGVVVILPRDTDGQIMQLGGTGAGFVGFYVKLSPLRLDLNTANDGSMAVLGAAGVDCLSSHTDPTRLRISSNGQLQLKSDGKIQVSTSATDATSGTGPSIQWGAGSPETVVAATVGSLFLRTDGGAATTLYVKESGSGNTGWVAK